VYLRYKTENENQNFQPMTLEQIKESPLISSIVDKNADKKIAYLKEKRRNEQKLYKNSDTMYFSQNDLTTSSSLPSYLDEEKQEISRPQSKYYSSSEPTVDRNSYSTDSYAYTKGIQELSPSHQIKTSYEKQELSTPQWKTNSNSEPNIQQKSQLNNRYTNTNDKQNKWIPIINNNYNSGQNLDKNQESSQMRTYQNSESYNEHKPHSNYRYSNSDDRQQNNWSPNQNNNFDHNWLRSYSSHSNSENQESPKTIYVNQVPNSEHITDDSTEHEDHGRDPISRLLNRSRLRAKKIIMDDFVLS
jgi:hypothetical protein